MPESGKFYMLVNPYIAGSTPKIFKADNSFTASKQAYESVSKYFNNEVPSFNFTLLKLKSGAIENESKLQNLNLEEYGKNASSKLFNKNNFSHFTVEEQQKSKGQVSFTINKFEGKVSNLDTLMNNIFKIQQKYKSNQTGGNSSDDSSSSQTGGSTSESYSSTQSGGSSDESSYQSDESSYQSGGASSDSKSDSDNKHRRSKYDDDDDDSPDYYVKKYYYDPISYWYYAPALYGLNSFYFPMFSAPLSAQVYIDSFFPSVYFNASTVGQPNATFGF